MEKLNFVALDFEYVTVKGDQYPKHVTQVGIVRVENGAIVERYCTYVKPLCSKKEFDKDSHAKRKTGIKYGMLEDKPTFVELWDSLFDKLNGNLVVVHNASTADLPALTNELERNNISRSGSMWPMFDCICTYKIGGCKLEKLCELYNVVNETTHDACCDADATARVVIAMRNEERFFALSDLEKIHYDCSYHIGGHNSKRTSYNQCNAIEPTEFDIELDNILRDNPNQYRGQNIVLTGFDTYTKNLYKNIFNLLGANIQSNICNSTTLLVTGWKPGLKKIQKAKEIGIPIISHWDLTSNEDTEHAI